LKNNYEIFLTNFIFYYIKNTEDEGLLLLAVIIKFFIRIKLKYVSFLNYTKQLNLLFLQLLFLIGESN